MPLTECPACAQADSVADPLAAVALVVQRCPARKLMAIYKVPSFEGPEGLLQHVAAARGRLLPGGVPDLEVRLCVLALGDVDQWGCLGCFHSSRP